mgnify:CR=1 FL=1
MSRRNLSGSTEIAETITSDDILGKQVIDAEGEFIGVVDIVHIHPTDLDFVGISIDKGFFQKGLIIGKNYIERITKHALFLKIRPIFDIKKMSVFDKEGVKIGSVAEVILVGNRNALKELVVSTGLLKSVTIPADLIDFVGENVFLKVTKDELKSMGESK